jgi:phospholipid N-methyltransferase
MKFHRKPKERQLQMQLFTGIKVMSQFLSELIKNLRFIRAVTPSSQSLVEKMTEKIDFKQILCICI